MVVTGANAQPVYRFDVHQGSYRLVFIIIQYIRRSESITYHQVISKFYLSKIMTFQADAGGMQWNITSIKKQRAKDSWEEHPAMMVGIIPVIDRRMVLAYEQIIIAGI